MIFHEMYFSWYILLTRFHFLIVFTSWDIGQFYYCNCLVTRLWHQKFWVYPKFFNQAVFLNDQTVNSKIYISWERKELLRWNKKHFSSYLKGHWKREAGGNGVGTPRGGVLSPPTFKKPRKCKKCIQNYENLNKLFLFSQSLGRRIPWIM